MRRRKVMIWTDEYIYKTPIDGGLADNLKLQQVEKLYWSG